MPLVGGGGTGVTAHSGAMLETIAYLVASERLCRAPSTPPVALDALLGAPRAHLLAAAAAATTIGRLAETLRAVPSAASYHVDAVEAAGLVQRQRRGRHVLVQRTQRGERLLELYDADAAAARASGAGSTQRGGWLAGLPPAGLAGCARAGPW